MSAVVEFVEDIGDAIGDAVETIGDVAEDIVDTVVDVVEDVGKTIEKTVQAALDDPLRTIATIAAIATQQHYLIPYINAGATLARGGNFEDALKSYAISTVAAEAGSFVGGEVSGMLGDTVGAGTAQVIGKAVGAGASGATSAALTGGDVEDAFLNALVNYGVRAGVNYGINEAGQIVDQMGRPAPEDVIREINSDVAQSLGGNVVTYDDGSSITYDADGNPVSATATNGGNIFFNPQTPEDYLASQQEPPFIGDVESGDPIETPGEGVTESPIEGETAGSDITETPLGEMPGVVTNPDGTTTQTFDDGSTITFDASGNPISASDIDGNLIEMPEFGGDVGDQVPTGEGTPGEDVVGEPTEDVGDQAPTDEVTPGEDVVGEPTEDVGDQAPTPESQLGPTMTRNPDGTITQRFDDGSSMTYDNAGNVLGTSDATDLGYGGSNWNWGAIGDYAKNMFTRQLSNKITRNLLGQDQPRAPIRSPQTQRMAQYGVRTPEDIGFEAFDFAPQPTDDTEGITNFNLDQSDGATPISPDLWNPLAGASWAPQQRISGLGFAGKFVNPQTDGSTYYTNQDQIKEQQLRQKAAQQGWLTDEELQALKEEKGADASIDPNDFSVQLWDPSKIEFAAQGGLMGHNPEFYSEGGASLANRYVKGAGDGTSDSIPAMLASGEFVIPADVVSSLGNGDNDAGAQALDKFMLTIRKHKRNADPNGLPPDSKGALEYLAMATKKKKVG